MLLISVGAPASDFLKGADISMLPKYEELGVEYSNHGVNEDLIRIMRSYGCNTFRVRLFVNPTMKNAVIQDLPFVIDLAQRVKEQDATLILDMHFSDTWADPGHQLKPAKWESLDFPKLVLAVENYSKKVIQSMKSAGCQPDIVQIGNEITPGFLWPEGRVDSPGFPALLKAAINGVKSECDAKIMIHVDQNGVWFFQNLEQFDIDFDLIGLSYYPKWHGTMEQFAKSLHDVGRFEKDIIVVETAHKQLGQKEFLEDLIEIVQHADFGAGVLWWYPESVLVPGLEVWENGKMALFDKQGNALPTLEAFR